MAQLISDNVRLLWYAFTMNWARYVLLAGLLAGVFLLGRYSN